jgi:hypothetical protein
MARHEPPESERAFVWMDGSRRLALKRKLELR